MLISITIIYIICCRYIANSNIFQVFVSVNSAWVTPAESQYHIQTDEGPERYFRYQTDSGQYRKERRLADGTIIGFIIINLTNLHGFI